MINRLFLIACILASLKCNAQLSDSLKAMQSDTEVNFPKYEELLFDATEYVFNNPLNFKSEEFISACRIIDYWKNKDTGIRIVLGGAFYDSLNPKSNQRYLYMIAIMNHILDQKLNHNRFLRCVKLEGQKFSEQDDVRETQLEGAKIFLDYVSNENNGLSLNSKSKKFLKAYHNGELNKIFFK